MKKSLHMFFVSCISIGILGLNVSFTCADELTTDNLKEAQTEIHPGPITDAPIYGAQIEISDRAMEYEENDIKRIYAVCVISSESECDAIQFVADRLIWEYNSPDNLGHQVLRRIALSPKVYFLSGKAELVKKYKRLNKEIYWDYSRPFEYTRMDSYQKLLYVFVLPLLAYITIDIVDMAVVTVSHPVQKILLRHYISAILNPNRHESTIHSRAVLVNAMADAITKLGMPN